MVFTPFGLRSRYNLTNLSEIDFNPYAQFIHTCDDNIFLYDIGSQGRPPKLFEWQRDDFYPLAKNQKWNVRDHCIVEVMSHKDVNRILATSFNNTFYINIIWDKQKLKMETNSDFKINSKSNNVTLNITAEGPRSNWRITLDTLPTR